MDRHPLGQDITVIKGIGEETAGQLADMRIYTVRDLLYYLPYRYDDTRLRDLAEVAHDERVTIEGKVQSEPSLVYYGRKKNRLTVQLLVGHYLVKAVMFNRGYLKSRIKLHSTITVTGKWDKHRLAVTVTDVKLGPHDMGEFQPVYAVKGHITVKAIRRYIGEAYKEFGSHIQEDLPSSLIEKYRLAGKRHALELLHFPKNEIDMKQGRRRIVYEEFLLFQLKMQALRQMRKERTRGVGQHYDLKKLKDFIASLSFSLTNAQKKAVNEICADLKSPYKMNRLLQGDVGSGKTIVAAIALMATVTADFQGALMVPTEILAEQHYESLHSLFSDWDLSVELLTSSVKGKKRAGLLESLQKGEIDILIGTHSLIQEDVGFARLGLVITDEQHRFGVEQRRILRDKAENPDVLFMTATPIPRTLAITVFGEMDVTVINEMPKGRKPVETHWAKHDMLDRVLDLMEKELKQGSQAYVICPLIEESDKLDVQNAIDVYEMLSAHFSGRFSTGLMHGRLHPAEKDEVMKEFSLNHIQVLVSTTVVEVGVNVPNATFMVVYDAERFGLAQLHQLRGRVGRGTGQSYCVLLADPKTEIGKERMRIMTETNDGFVLSERDLELRGPGDFFGRKQSGLPEFKMADMVHDYRVLEVAREDALSLVNSEAFWNDEEYLPLRTNLEESGALSEEKLD